MEPVDLAQEDQRLAGVRDAIADAVTDAAASASHYLTLTELGVPPGTASRLTLAWLLEGPDEPTDDDG